MVEEDARWYFSLLDHDNDGAVDMKEWLRLLQRLQGDDADAPGEAWVEQQALRTSKDASCRGACTPREIFAMYDSNGDDVVSEEELFDWLLTKGGRGGSRSLWMPPDAPMEVHLSMLDPSNFTVTWVTKCMPLT